MKRCLFCAAALALSYVTTSCDKLEDLGILPESQKYHIEMGITWQEWGLYKTFISNDTEWYWNIVTGDTLEFHITENNGGVEGLTTFGLTRRYISIPCDDSVTREAVLSMRLYLQDIKLEEGVKYYFGDTEERDISDGVCASTYTDNYGTEISSYIALNMRGYTGYNSSTLGWVKFTKIELTHDNDEGFADAYDIDLQFGFEVKDPETGEIIQMVEHGNIIKNPGTWEVCGVR